MDSATILKQVNEIFIDVLENPKIIVTRESVANDVEDWDSLNHIQLVVAIEKHFKVRFTTNEISAWKNVGEMCDVISARTTV